MISKKFTPRISNTIIKSNQFENISNLIPQTNLNNILFKLYRPLHNYYKIRTQLYTTLQNFAKLSTQFYKPFTKLNKTLHNFTQLYTTIHNFTTLYTTHQHL
jgi:hypothetical protein